MPTDSNRQDVNDKLINANENNKLLCCNYSEAPESLMNDSHKEKRPYSSMVDSDSSSDPTDSEEDRPILYRVGQANFSNENTRYTFVAKKEFILEITRKGDKVIFLKDDSKIDEATVAELQEGKEKPFII